MHLVITSKTRVLVYLLGLAVGASKGGVGFLAVWQTDALFSLLFKEVSGPAPPLRSGSIRVDLRSGDFQWPHGI